MKKSIAVLMLTLCLAGCESAPRVVPYRLTLTVDTPEGPKTGSSIVELHVVVHDGLLQMGSAFSSGVRGEATVVDLGKRGLLFCLLTRDEDRLGSTSAEYALAGALHPGDRPKDLLSFYDGLNRNRPMADIPFHKLPMLIRFLDISDQRTAERVDPFNLERRFGSGVRLERATIEVVSNGWWPFNRIGWPQSLAGEKSTEGIAQILPWTTNLRGGISRDINDGSFWQGRRK